MRSVSPSMLFRCRSRPGSQSPEPSPRLVVRTQALPVGVDDGDVRRVPVAGHRAVERGEQRVGAARRVEARERLGDVRRGRRASARGARRTRPRRRRPVGAYAARSAARDRARPLARRARAARRRSCRVDGARALVADELERATSPGCCSRSPSASSLPAGRVDRPRLRASSSPARASQARDVRRRHRRRRAREPQRRLDEPRPRQPPVRAPERVEPGRHARHGARRRADRVVDELLAERHRAAPSARPRPTARRRSSRGCARCPLAASR